MPAAAAPSEAVPALAAAEEALAAATAAYHAAREAALASLVDGGHGRGNPAVAGGFLAWHEQGEARRVKLPTPP